MAQAAKSAKQVLQHNKIAGPDVSPDLCKLLLKGWKKQCRLKAGTFQ